MAKSRRAVLEGLGEMAWAGYAPYLLALGVYAVISLIEWLVVAVF